MKTARRINSNPTEQTVKNFMAATNAFNRQQIENGVPGEYLSAQNAAKTYKSLVRTVIALADPGHKDHNKAFNALREQVNRNQEAINHLANMGDSYRSTINKLFDAEVKRGISPEQAMGSAFNSIAGNPIYDHFANLAVLAGQLYEEKVLVENCIKEGDAFALPTEPGGTGQDKTRFRVPAEQVVGSAKIRQGDINPIDRMRYDENRVQVNLYNEFKNVATIESAFSIDQDMRDQALGYASSAAPALAGFILQNRYFGAQQELIMKEAELLFADGIDSNGNFTANVGGSYGLLSESIRLKLASASAASPLLATNSDWTSNPTKLIQCITNYNFIPASVTAPINADGDPSKMYQDIVRLLNLPAQQNINFAGNKWTLYVPTSLYALAVQYPGSGTFNKQLAEMIKTAVGDRIVENIEVVPSSMMNYRASNAYGATGSAYNYMALVAHGADNEKKPLIMPGQTAAPVVTSDNVSAQIMNFSTRYVFGGPMILHYGGVFLMEFSKAS